MPAPAGSNVGREGSITASIAELVTFESGHFSTKKAHFRPTLFTPKALLAMPLGGCAGFAVYLALVPDFHVETIGSGPR